MSALARLLLWLSEGRLIWGLLFTGALIAAVEEWRICLLVLLLQYTFVGLSLVLWVPSHLALAKIIVGGMVFFILYPTAQRGRQAADGGKVASSLYRWAGCLLAGLGAYGLFYRHPLPQAPAGLTLSSYLLVAMGLLAVILARDLFKAGLGLLTFQAGFEILFTALESGLVVAGLLGMVNILLALATSYLAAAQLARRGRSP